MQNDAFVVSGPGPVSTVTLLRPTDGNKLKTADIQALGKAIRRLGEAPDAKIVVLRAEGDAFCLGREPSGDAPKTKTALSVRSGVTEPILELYADLRATPVPVIAVVQGDAKGFGCAMVGQCDLAIAADTARFSLPEMDVNLPPTLAISAVLGKVPPKRLLHMVYTRRQIDADTALSMGLLSEVVPRSELDAAVERTLECFTDRSRAALCAVKEYMSVAPYADSLGSARIAANLLSVVLSSPDK